MHCSYILDALFLYFGCIVRIFWMHCSHILDALFLYFFVRLTSLQDYLDMDDFKTDGLVYLQPSQDTAGSAECQDTAGSIENQQPSQDTAGAIENQQPRQDTAGLIEKQQPSLDTAGSIEN